MHWPRLTLHDSTPVGFWREREARKTQNNVKENRGERKVNVWVVIMETGKDCHTGQSKMETSHQGLLCRRARRRKMKELFKNLSVCPWNLWWKRKRAREWYGYLCKVGQDSPDFWTHGRAPTPPKKKTRGTGRKRTCTEAADPVKFLQLTLSRSGKNSVKNSWIRIQIRISTKVEWFIAIVNYQKFDNKSSTTSWLIGKILLELPISQWQKFLEKFLYPPHDSAHHQNLISCW